MAHFAELNSSNEVLRVVVISNTDVDANGWTANSGSYGWFLPDVGLILLNGEALDGPTAGGGIALGTLRNSDTPDNNPTKLFNALKTIC